MKGKFIVLEGLDRCGKSSMVKFLQERDEARTVSIAFPNRKSSIGSMINDFLSNKTNINNEAIHLLFSANRWESMKEINEILSSGKNIICDRYWYSGVAYSYAKGLNFEWCMAADEGLREPDLVIILKGDPKKLAQRDGYGEERYEKVEFQEKVSEAFFKLEKSLDKRYIQSIDVDGKSLEEVRKEVFALVEGELSE